MEFDLGNILYIVITIVAVAAGLLGKKKKPAGKNGKGSETQAKPGFLENLERILNGVQQERMVVDLQDYEEDLEEEMITEPYEAPVPKGESLMEEYERLLADRQGDRGFENILSQSDFVDDPLEIVDLDDDDGGNDFSEIITDFNAANAVVYSTIINRLDY